MTTFQRIAMETNPWIWVSYLILVVGWTVWMIRHVDEL